MKLQTLAAIGFFFASVAGATCPDLKGAYTCTYEDGSQESLVIDQFEDQGQTYYEINGNVVPTDGQVYNLPDDQEMINQTLSYFCNDNQFVVDYAGDYIENGAFAGNLVNKTYVAKTNRGDLSFNDQGTFTSPDGQVYPWNDTLVCAKN